MRSGQASPKARLDISHSRCYAMSRERLAEQREPRAIMQNRSRDFA